MTAAKIDDLIAIPPHVFMYSDDHGICVGGRFHGWIMWKHPDGQFVTIRKAEKLRSTDGPIFDAARSALTAEEG